MQQNTLSLFPRRKARRVRITERNEVMIFMDVSNVYPSDNLPAWFKPLQAIVEDDCFTCMVITLGDVHYILTIEDSASEQENS